MPHLIRSTRYAGPMFAAVAGFVILAAPFERALAQRPSTPVTVVNPQVPVTVDNPATSPVPAIVINPDTSPVPARDVDNPARHSFIVQCGIFTFGHPTGSPGCDLGTVPSGNVLVLETVAGSVGINSPPAIIRNIALVTGPAVYPLAAALLPLSAQGPFQVLTVTQPLRAYIAAEGPNLRVEVETAEDVEVDAQFVFSGYLVSVP